VWSVVTTLQKYCFHDLFYLLKGFSVSHFLKIRYYACYAIELIWCFIYLCLKDQLQGSHVDMHNVNVTSAI
jgi:hypothetical protein